MASCRVLQWSPLREVACTVSPYSSIFFWPLMGSPILPWQAGEGRQRLLAAASANLALESAVLAEGSSRIQAEDILSLWRHAQAALVLFGRTLVRAF